MFKTISKLSSLLLLTLFFGSYGFSQNDCGCTNCPLDINDNGNFGAEIFIQNTGPNTLGGDNCLTEVCFTVDHTWIGDLDFTLIAPDGTCYLIMADSDNDNGGCGTNCDGIDICIQVGTGNPAGTGTTEYGDLNGGGGNCVSGNYTVTTGTNDPNGPCGNTTNDLDAFNNGSGTVSGTWTLNVGDNCKFDTGQLTDWSLGFCDESGISCSSDPLCNVDYFEANISACVTGTGTYDVTGTVEFTAPPASGDLVVEDCFGTQHVIASAPFADPGSVNYTITGLPADGANCSLTTYFTDDLACINGPLEYTAPVCPCNFTNISANISACDPSDNTFEITGSVEFENPPTTGTLTISDCNGNEQVFTAPFTSPTNYAITGIDSDGTQNCELTASFSDDATCNITVGPYDNPEACQCEAEIGSFTNSLNGDANSADPYLLCFGDELSVTGNGDFIPSQDFNTGATYDPGVWLLVYNCAPTVFEPDDINTDPCLLGVASTNDQAWNIVNNAGDNSTFYFVPVTMYSMVDGIYAISLNGGEWCYDLGPIYETTFLQEITTTQTQDCQAGTATVTVNGGLPSFDGSLFTASNLAPGSASFDNTTAGDGGTITISGLVDGDNWSFDITDGNGCPVTVSGTFIGLEDPSFTYPDNTYCQSDADPSPTITGTTGADNCTAIPTVTHVGDVSDNNVCNGEVITRTYMIEDDCGNFIEVTQSITIDALTPTFTLAGTDPTECGFSDGYITISGLDPTTDYTLEYNGNAPTTITTDGAGAFDITGLGAGSYTGFTVSDVDCPTCSTTDGATVTLTDPNPPAVDAGPDQEVCEGSAVTLTADNPDGAIITWNNGVTDGVAFTSPVGTTTYTVTANLAGCINTDQVDVTVVPTIDALNCPAGLTAVCDITEQPAYGTFQEFIDAGGSITADAAVEVDESSFTLLSEVSDDNACPETVTRTYQVADTCGVTVECTQDIVINDEVNPEGTAPDDVLVQCIGDVPGVDITLLTGVSDNCTVNPTVTHVGDATDGNSCPEVITRTYRIEDDCGNFIEVEQLITVNDDINPEGMAPDDVLVQCIEDVPAADITSLTGVSDNCTADPTVTHIGDESDGETCPETITRTYRIEDACGNFIEVTQAIVVNDDTNPTASNPTPITVECDTDVPAPDVTVVTDEADNCTAIPTVTHLGDVSDNNVCNGEVITRTYMIEDDCGNFIEVTQTILIDSYTPTFTVEGTDPTTCSGTDGFITISGLDPNTDFEMEYDGNAPTTITSDGAGEYVITGLGAGSYTEFTVSDADCPSCSTTNGVTISLTDPNAPLVNAGPDQEVCEGESITLTANNPDGAIITWDNGVTDGAPFTQNVGTETYVVTANLNSCISTDQVSVTVHPNPTVFAGNDVIICENESVILTGSGAQTYAWDNGVTNGIAFTPQQTDVYMVIGTSAFGCENTDEVTVEVDPLPTVSFEADNLIGCLPVTTTFTNNSSPGDECTWYLGDGTVVTGCDGFTHTYNSVGCFTVTLEVKTVNGCTTTDTYNNYICVEDYPVADFNYSPNAPTSMFSEVDFSNNSIGAVEYEWYFGDGNTSEEINPSNDYGDNPGNYNVMLVANSSFGCADTAYSIVRVLEDLIYYVPNTFTPDEDQYNETFQPVFTSGFDPLNYKLLIFNRWGEVLFESNDASIGWDGTYGADSDQIVKDGTYVWKIEFSKKEDDERIMRVGHVNVLR